MVGDMKETERGESSTFALNKGGKNTINTRMNNSN